MWQGISNIPMTIIYGFVLLITLFGFAGINNAVAQEDVVEIEDKPTPIDSVASAQTQTAFVHSWWLMAF